MNFFSIKTRWEEQKIGDTCIVGDGAHASLKRQQTGIMYLTSKNFKNGGLDLSKVDYISEEDYIKYFRDNSKALTKPQTDDVLFSIIGTIGEPYLFKNQDKFGLSSSVSILRPNKSVIFPKYLFYWIKGHIFQEALYGIKGGVAQSYVSLEMIRSLPLYYPPLPTQKKIAAILSAYDDLIENNTRRIKILEEMAQTLYQEWFVKFRFPSHEHTILKDVCELIVDCEHKTAPIQATGYPSIRTPNIGKGLLLLDKVNRVSEETYQIWTKRAIPETHDLILAREAPIGNVAIIPRNLKVCLGQRTVLIRPDKNKVEPYYLLYSLLSDEIQTKLLSFSNGATVHHLNMKDIRNLELPEFAPLSIQKKFNDIVSHYYELIFNLMDKNSNLLQTRDLLLPKLISGEIDVEHLEITTEDIAA